MIKVLLDRVSHICGALNIHDDEVVGDYFDATITWELHQIRTDIDGGNRSENIVVEILFCPYCGAKLPGFSEIEIVYARG